MLLPDGIIPIYRFAVQDFHRKEAGTRGGHPCSWLMLANCMPHNELSPSGYSPCTAHIKKALHYTGLCGADGDRTRDLRRDRPAF